MTTTQLEAHIRMLSTFAGRVRTHIAPVRDTNKGKPSKAPRAVIVNGMRYDSASEAGRRSGLSRQCIVQRIMRGHPSCRYEEEK
jgi:hypothetical protein